jgi:hypothetical protein
MKMIRVTNLLQAILLMFIRNDCRKFLTHNQDKITIGQQIKWFNSELFNKNMYAYIFWNGYFPVGYGLVSERDGRRWISGGIIKMLRGKGFGFKLFHDLVHEYRHSELWLDVFKTNTIARKIYYKLNFRKQSEDITPYGNTMIFKRKAEHV